MMDWDMYTGPWPGGPQEVEIVAFDPRRPSERTAAIHLKNEEEWQEFLEALKYHGKILGWEEE